jgi:ligand-binding SRPBCC domain-containing protein
MGREIHFTAVSSIHAPAEEVFRWHADPDALKRLTPPWEPVEFLEPAPGIRDGDLGVLRVRVGPFRVRWVFQHRDYVEGRQFRDVQISGPFRRWDHTHRMIPEGPSMCRLEDCIEFELPFGWIGRFLGAWYVRRKLKKLFRYRHRLTAEAMAKRFPANLHGGG